MVLRFRVQGSGFRVQGLGLSMKDEVWGKGFKDQGSGFRIKDFELRIKGSRFTD